MKKLLMITMTLMAGFFYSSLIAAKNVETPVPEIIKCESQGNCEMTPLDILQSNTNH